MPEVTEDFSTPPSDSADANGESHTTGLHGTKRTLDDGTIIIEAREILTASRTDGLNGRLTATWKSVQKGDVITVDQDNYSYKARPLPPATLFLKIDDFPATLPPGFTATAIREVTASQFGKNDHEDEGTGSPDMGLVQTNSEVLGASVKVSIMEEEFGPNWRHNAKRLSTLAEVYFPHSKRLVRVPLVDIGPGETIKAEVDLTWASDQFLKTGGQASVRYRLLI
jgi:hypothetical protein